MKHKLKIGSTLLLLLFTGIAVMASPIAAVEPPAPPAPPARFVGDEIRVAILEALKEEGPRAAEQVRKAMSEFSWAWGESSKPGEGTDQAFMGITTEPIPPVLRDYAEIPPGVGILVTSLVAGGPAEESDLRVNDILLKLADQKIINQSQLSTLIRLQKPGDIVEVSLLRRGEYLKIKFTLGERRSPTGHWQVVGEHAPRALEIAQQHMPEIALRVLEGVDQWIPGSVRIMVDDEQKIEVDLKDLQLNLMELRDRLKDMRNIPEDNNQSGVETIRDTDGRLTRIFLGDRNLTYVDEHGRLRMEVREGREYYWVWGKHDEFLYEGYLQDVLLLLDGESQEMLKRFRDSLDNMSWEKKSGNMEIEMIIPDSDSR